MNVSESVPSDIYVPDVADCRKWADSACRTGSVCEANLQVVSRDEIRELNRDYRDRDDATNVLSFPMRLPDEIGINLIGDLAISAEVVAEEAEQQGKDIDAHWAHMIIHGMLHLQGFDHIEEAQAEEMESIEQEIMGRLGFESPY